MSCSHSKHKPAFSTGIVNPLDSGRSEGEKAKPSGVAASSNNHSEPSSSALKADLFQRTVLELEQHIQTCAKKPFLPFCAKSAVEILTILSEVMCWVNSLPNHCCPSGS
jgi:hypothetical protein